MVNTKTGTVTSYSKLGPGHGIPLGFELLWDIDDQLISASRLIDRDNEDGTTLLKNLTEVLIEEALSLKIAKLDLTPYRHHTQRMNTCSRSSYSTSVERR